jgi:hypothetical protein
LAIQNKPKKGLGSIGKKIPKNFTWTDPFKASQFIHPMNFIESTNFPPADTSALITFDTKGSPLTPEIIEQCKKNWLNMSAPKAAEIITDPQMMQTYGDLMKKYLPKSEDEILDAMEGVLKNETIAEPQTIQMYQSTGEDILKNEEEYKKFSAQVELEVAKRKTGCFIYPQWFPLEYRWKESQFLPKMFSIIKHKNDVTPCYTGYEFKVGHVTPARVLDNNIYTQTENGIPKSGFWLNQNDYLLPTGIGSPAVYEYWLVLEIFYELHIDHPHSFPKNILIPMAWLYSHETTLGSLQNLLGSTVNGKYVQTSGAPGEATSGQFFEVTIVQPF